MPPLARLNCQTGLTGSGVCGRAVLAALAGRRRRSRPSADSNEADVADSLRPRPSRWLSADEMKENKPLVASHVLVVVVSNLDLFVSHPRTGILCPACPRAHFATLPWVARRPRDITTKDYDLFVRRQLVRRGIIIPLFAARRRPTRIRAHPGFPPSGPLWPSSPWCLFVL